MPRRCHAHYPIVTALSLAATASITLGLSACTRHTASATPAPRTVLVATATPYMLGGVEFVGEVRARQRGELAFAASGVVKQVLVEPSDKVRRGQLLAAIETVVPQAQLDAAGAEVERLQVSLNEALRKQERLHAARESGSASEAEWSAAQTEMQMAAAALAAARAQREGSAWARAQAELRAPFDGYVASRQLEVG